MTSSEPNSNPLPVWLVLVSMAIPQGILLLLNIRSWTLIHGEASDANVGTAFSLLSLELTLLCLTVGLVVYSGRILFRPKLWQCVVWLAIHIGVMLTFLMNIHDAIPDTIQPWILQEGQVGLWSSTLLMPGAFVALFFATRRIVDQLSLKKSGIIALVTTLVIPTLWYFLVTVAQPIALGQVGVVLNISLGVVLVVVFLIAIVAMFDKLLGQFVTDRYDARYLFIVGLLGILAPLGGLWLNKTIPFPTDFQSLGIYLLTVFNGVILALKPVGQSMSPLRLFLRCVTFPFIAYFFLVFLPYLPLSLIAIVIMGAGFLMLTPLALGLFQSRVTYIEFRLSQQRLGAVKTTLICLAGLAVIPTYLSWDALRDRHALYSSLDYFYAHNFDGPALTKSQTQRAATALVKLRDRKAGIQPPYISGMYNALVFGDMVITDQKIRTMHQWLTGRDLPNTSENFFQSRSTNNARWGRGRLIPPHRDTKLSHFMLTASSNQNATVRLTLQNQSADTHAVYAEQIALPDGVFITGLRLKIGDNWESAKFIDKKTAIWVFQKITEVRRDPALIYYHTANRAELRVYPFPAHGIREVELDVSFHPNSAALIQLGKETIRLNTAPQQPAVLFKDGTVLKSLEKYAFMRTPYLHFILDISQDQNVSPVQRAHAFAAQIAHARQYFKVQDFRITAANLTSSIIGDGRFHNSGEQHEIAQIIQDTPIDFTGGFWLERALANAISEQAYAQHAGNLSTFPVFVVLSNQAPKEEPSLAAWRWLIPELNAWYSMQDDTISKHTLTASNPGSNADSPADDWPAVIAFSVEDTIRILPAHQTSLLDATRSAHVFDPAKSGFVPINPEKTLTENDALVQQMSLWHTWRQANLNPASLNQARSELLTQSRAQSMLLPTTSLIVVESASQWEMLARKEKQALANHTGLEFDDEQQTPEPAWWILLLALLLFLYKQDQRSLANRPSAPSQ